jgi:hypothetical protein
LRIEVHAEHGPTKQLGKIFNKYDTQEDFDMHIGREKRTQVMYVRVRPTLKQALERAAAREGISLSELVDRLLAMGKRCEDSRKK